MTYVNAQRSKTTLETVLPLDTVRPTVELLGRTVTVTIPQNPWESGLSPPPPEQVACREYDTAAHAQRAYFDEISGLGGGERWVAPKRYMAGANHGIRIDDDGRDIAWMAGVRLP